MNTSAEDTALERAAHDAVLVSVRRMWTGPDPAIHPNASLKSLGDNELGWITHGAISSWIFERSKQVTQSRTSVERLICSMQGKPEPWELGSVGAALPALGQYVEDNGLTNLAIGQWSRESIVGFVWACFQTIDEARTARDEIPEEIPFDPDPHPLVMAG